MATNRWFLRDKRTNRVITVEGWPGDHPEIEYEGYDRDYHPDGRVKREERMFTYRGRKYTGKKGKATQSDAISCNRNCETAKNPECRCACGGKNHGIAHRVRDDDKVD
jgi:hypothetical protein